MLKNSYLVAKIGVDTAENEPSKVCRAPLNPLLMLARSSAAPSTDRPRRVIAALNLLSRKALFKIEKSHHFRSESIYSNSKVSPWSFGLFWCVPKIAASRFYRVSVAEIFWNRKACEDEKRPVDGDFWDLLCFRGRLFVWEAENTFWTTANRLNWRRTRATSSWRKCNPKRETLYWNIDSCWVIDGILVQTTTKKYSSVVNCRRLNWALTRSRRSANGITGDHFQKRKALTV